MYRLLIFPDQANQTNHYEISIPKLASYVNTHDWDGELPGLDQVPLADQPSVPVIFWTFRIMVGLGISFIFVPLFGVLLGSRIYQRHWFHIIGMLMTPMGLVATTCGWMTAEIGRQPWAVYGLLRTKDLASQVSVSQVLTSLICLILVYGLVFGYFFMKYLLKVIQKGPDRNMEIEEHESLAFNYMSTFEGEGKEKKGKNK